MAEFVSRIDGKLHMGYECSNCGRTVNMYATGHAPDKLGDPWKCGKATATEFGTPPPPKSVWSMFVKARERTEELRQQHLAAQENELRLYNLWLEEQGKNNPPVTLARYLSS